MFLNEKLLRLQTEVKLINLLQELTVNEMNRIDAIIVNSEEVETDG